MLQLLLLLVIVSPVFARDVEIIVEDTELGLPLEGAVIRSWDGARYTCDERGMAVISVPDDRQVVIQAAYPGYENARLVITVGAGSFTLGLRLSGIMENRELVIEAARPGVNETKTGRSIAVSGRDIAQTAEIGLIEDVMSTVKLLPGVGYAGFFNAQPSIRGGDPGDMTASLDGFYIANPYHWGGGFSIFDPHMVQSAQLSHGVFSSRYGHTISGLLDITSKKPSPTETEFELGINTSAASYNLSLPLDGRGGVLFMGRVTYYDPVIWLFKRLADITDLEELKTVHAIRVAPYIRNGTITGNYRFFDNLEFNATGFWGMDGVGVSYKNSTRTNGLESDSGMEFDWTNYQGFITTGLTWNPRNDMLLKLTAGAGYHEAVVDADITNKIYKKTFNTKTDYYGYLQAIGDKFHNTYDLEDSLMAKETDKTFNAQGRIDYDWELGKGFLVAAGVQEMFNRYSASGSQRLPSELWLGNLDPDEQEMIFSDMGLTGDTALRDLLKECLRVSFPFKYDPDVGNRMFTTSGYGLVEYYSPDNRFAAELGVRVDHFYLTGKDDLSLQSRPAFNPRFNVDFNVFKNLGFVESFDLSAGTGLFSSMNSMANAVEKKYGLTEIKPNRSWTSVVGTKLELTGGFIFNIEGYYKYIFDRTYIPISLSVDDIEVRPQFNGEGRAWGIDFLLQKLQSRFWDGWLSYSYNWTRYRDPDAGNSQMGISGGVRGDDWYFPSYHRFHNLNLVLNIKPTANINIYTRFGLASGVQLPRRIGQPESYPVYVYNPEDPERNKFIEKYYWFSVWDDDRRTTPSLPMDVKLSFFGKSRSGKIRHELYVAIENVLALLYNSQGNTSFNSYTGEVDTGSDTVSYEIPIPIPSFGFKISY
jgi:hypothetical protein